MTNIKAYIALTVAGILLILVGFLFAHTEQGKSFGAIGTNAIENYIPAILYNEGYYSNLPIQTTSTISSSNVSSSATSTLSDLTLTSSATTSLKILSTSSTQGGCIQVNATSTATNSYLRLSPLGATSTFAGTVYFAYGVCE